EKFLCNIRIFCFNISVIVYCFRFFLSSSSSSCEQFSCLPTCSATIWSSNKQFYQSWTWFFNPTYIYNL
ncbi:hypothetical protein L1887_37046, partial [Cichorium endivia]